MPDTDQLRNALAQIAKECVDDCVAFGMARWSENFAIAAKKVEALLADPELRVAILSGPMNLEVEEFSEWPCKKRDGEMRDYRCFVDLDADYPYCNCGPTTVTRYTVRPRSERRRMPNSQLDPDGVWRPVNGDNGSQT